MRIYKRNLAAIALVVGTTISSMVPVYAASNHSDFCAKRMGVGERATVQEVSEPIMVDNPGVSLLRASTGIAVTSPCDEEWRKKYSSWAYEANRLVERADDELYKKFGIDFTSVAQPLWSSSSKTYQDLFAEVKREHGLTYNGSKKAKLMVAFTGQTPSNDKNVTGYGSVGQGYSLIFDNGYSTNAETTQHEIGHNYGNRHCEDESSSKYGDKSCVMTAVGFGHIGKFCTGHNTQWSKNKGKY